MVAHPRASLGAGSLRPLNAPAPVQVQADAAGRPLAVRRPSWPAPRPVVRIQDRWRLDDEWWRERPIARLYYVLELADGQLLTVYQDGFADRWFLQRELGAKASFPNS